DEIYKVVFDYRQQGTLWKKEYWYNDDLFNTYDARSQYYIYDELERLQYVGLGYDESPTEEYYLCYEGDSMTPFSYLTLSKRYLEMGCIEVSDYAETYFPKDGINAFLQQAGLTRNDIFYQYQWHNEDSDGVLWTHSDSCLTLYCDKERGVGCGYLEYPKEYSPFMRGFIFKGDVKVDCSKTDPYAVYAEYGCDDSISIHNWSFEEFQKDQSSFYCDYDDKGRILRTLVIGNRDIERFYIYEGDNELPSYCFNIVHGSSSGVTLFEFD
ncbi:MAG: hypothetical protein K2M91_00890, partial [Lachnospiraceae bacterium]|nr:hypothetical protein [Lachnospiraceae bacterium]